MVLSTGVIAEGLSPAGIYALCKTADINNYTANEGCHQYYTNPDKWCSDKAGQICIVSGETRADLCVKTGKAIGVPFVEWSSGWGTFDSKEACLKACNRKSVVDFGGKCFGLVP